MLMLFEENQEIMEEVIKLSGILLKIAEARKNYKNFYLDIMEKINEINFFMDKDPITVLGEAAW